MCKKDFLGTVLKLSLFVTLIFLLVQSVEAQTKIGVSYRLRMRMIEKAMSAEALENTKAQSVRIIWDWGYIESIVEATGSWDALHDTLHTYVPEGLEPIIAIGFWHPDKMDAPPGAPPDYVYKAENQEEFGEFCYNFAQTFAGEINTFMLHNEPNVFWSPDTGSVNWGNSPEEFAMQATTAIENIRAVIPDAYIIYTGFSGWSHDIYRRRRANVDAFVDPIAPDGCQNPIIDGIDFHVTGLMLLNPFMEEIADSIYIYCKRKNLDWMILETGGPEERFPVEELVPGDPELTIWEAIYRYRGEDLMSFAEIRDSLYTWTRFYDPTHLRLPENQGFLEGKKITAFNHRFRAFTRPTSFRQPAKYVHWFTVYRTLDPISYYSSPVDPVNVGNQIFEFLRAERKKASALLLIESDSTESITLVSERYKEFVQKWFSKGNEPSTQNHVYEIPTELSLCQNYPNPFNPLTEIKYQIPAQCHAKLEIFDILGRKIDVLADSPHDTGSYSVIWNADGYASGVYFYRLITGDEVITRKMVLLR
ncbi:MAG: T9SS type A sorting domain-containing protein [candidate division Zixibacteria bacterium]|nr:T9SS type A sorting domain-containing protein [candidate division Zixibacteria bacterium]